MNRCLLQKILTLAMISISVATMNARAEDADDGLPRDRGEITRLQIYLDNHHFSPGPIDGSLGTFTKRAVAYHRLQDPEASPTPAEVWARAKRELPDIFITHRIDSQDHHWVGDLPATAAAQAKWRRLPYTSLAEFLGERYHADPRFLEHLNPHLDLANLKTGDLVIVPNVREVFRIEDLAGKPSGPASREPIAHPDCLRFHRHRSTDGQSLRGHALVGGLSHHPRPTSIRPSRPLDRDQHDHHALV